MAKSTRRRIRRNVSKAIVYIKATFNNTLITITDTNGDAICRDSGGTVGFKAMRFGVREVEIKVKGPGSGRESAISALQQAGLRIASIEDITPIPHNGCRPRKRRRV